MIIKEVENPKLKDLLGGTKRQAKESITVAEKDSLNEIKIVGSGKGALAIILRYLSEKKIILNKLDEILITDWIGYWVYNQIQPFAFPVKKFSDRTKVIFVYHQYGFPQDMDKILEFAHDKKLILIEDCAHSIASYYKGKLLGSFGDFTIYSFSKWFFCFALGGVKSKFEDFSEFADDLIRHTPLGLTGFKDLSKLFSDLSAGSKTQAFSRLTGLLMNMSYSIYGEALKPGRLALRLLGKKLKEEITVRQKRYSYFLERTERLGLGGNLEREGVTPYIIPVIGPEEKNKELVAALARENIKTGIYRFDVNRSLLSPKFVPCVWAPCHGGISDKQFDAIIEIILKTLK